MTNRFREQLQQLIDTSKIVIDRPKHSAHPRFPEIIYPLDYGYLDGTVAGDGEGIDVWVGSIQGARRLVATVATVDLFKRDAEIKLLVNCTDDEMQIIVDFYKANQMGWHLIKV